MIYDTIKKRLESQKYLSANFRLALVKDGESWKVSTVLIILDVKSPTGHKTLVKDYNFVLEDYSVSIQDFNKFLDYLKKVNIQNITFENNLPKLTDEHFFTLGQYKLCFIGNFPSPEAYFFGSSVSKEYHGINKPVFLVDYAIHTSVVGNPHRIDLSGNVVPLRNAIDAINYFWGTNYEQYNLPFYCRIYLPTYDARISSCIFLNDSLKIMIDFDPARIKSEELFVSVIVDAPQKYRERKQLHEKELVLDLGFIPDYGSVFLYKNEEKMDEYNYSSPIRNEKISQIMSDIQSGTQNSNISQQSTIDIEELLEENFIRLLPKHVQNILLETNKAFSMGIYRASVILIRAVMEELITIALKVNGKEQNLYNDRGEIGLQGKINLLISIPRYKNLQDDLELIKWFGDKSTHEALMPVLKRDVKDNIEPKFRLFLTRFIENDGLKFQKIPDF